MSPVDAIVPCAPTRLWLTLLLPALELTPTVSTRKVRSSVQVTLRVRMALLEKTQAPQPANAIIAEAVLDPYVNAIHVSLLREKQLNPVYAEHFIRIGAGTDTARDLGEKLLSGGPEKLKPTERMTVMADQRVMVWLHQQAWLRPEEKLAPWWKAMIREFSREN